MKLYLTQKSISSSLYSFFDNNLNLSKPNIKNLSYIIPSMISSESVVTSDIARKFKDSFIQLESLERKFRRFFKSFSPFAYSSYNQFIIYIINLFKVKHPDKNIHITFEHMYCRDDFSILLFSLRIGNQSIPIWFRCFKGGYSPDALDLSLIKEGISYCAELFKDYHVIFLANRLFSFVDIFKHIESLNCFYCIRSKSDITYIP